MIICISLFPFPFLVSSFFPCFPCFIFFSFFISLYYFLLFLVHSLNRGRLKQPLPATALSHRSSHLDSPLPSKPHHHSISTTTPSPWQQRYWKKKFQTWGSSLQELSPRSCFQNLTEQPSTHSILVPFIIDYCH